MIVAFLQNAYTSSEEQARLNEKRLADMDARERWVWQVRHKIADRETRNHTYLRLANVFGENLCRLIWWDNASPNWGWQSHHKFEPHTGHIRRVLQYTNPTVVLAFGKMAEAGLKHVQAIGHLGHATLICGPHPAARHATVTADLRLMHALTIAAESCEECPHCNQLTYGGSHCYLCHQAMYESDMLCRSEAP